MERSDIQKHVLEYATSCTAPFTAAIAFDKIEAIETAKQVSDALGRLYNQRILARRKVDKIRYEYIRSEVRPVGFEMAPEQPAAEQKIAATNADTPDVGELLINAIEKQFSAALENKTTDKEPEEPEKPTTQNVESQKPDTQQKTSRIKEVAPLSDDELIEKANDWVAKLCESGGRAWQLTIPVDVKNDPDMIFSELAKRFAKSKRSKSHTAETKSQPDWLKKAHDIVHGDREKTYGDPAKNLRIIAQYWSTHTGITLTETDVCIMMQLLKIARLKNNPDHVDSWIDIAGYAALKNRIKNECEKAGNGV